MAMVVVVPGLLALNTLSEITKAWLLYLGIFFLLMVVLGGAGRLWGPVVGTVVFFHGARLIPIVSAGSLLFLALLGGVAARAGAAGRRDPVPAQCDSRPRHPGGGVEAAGRRKPFK